MLINDNGEYVCPRCGDVHDVKELLFIEDSSFLKTPDLFLIYNKGLKTTKENCCYNCRNKLAPNWAVDTTKDIDVKRKYKISSKTNYFKHWYRLTLIVVRTLKNGLVLCEDITSGQQIKVCKKDLVEVTK